MHKICPHPSFDSIVCLQVQSAPGHVNSTEYWASLYTIGQVQVLVFQGKTPTEEIEYTAPISAMHSNSWK